MTNDVFGAGRAFLDREGRLIERRLAAVLFDDADPCGAVAAVLAYRNPDAGFGHGLEPDKRCPHSLPIDVERAFDVFLMAAESDRYEETCRVLAKSEVVRDACDWLGSVAQADGAVPLAFPVIEDYPRADHWTEWTYEPGLNPTAGLAGRLQVSPLHFAPSPDSPWTALFDETIIAGHLDRMVQDQQADGGWPIAWTPPGTASVMEWRGIETLRALRTLKAYGRI